MSRRNDDNSEEVEEWSSEEKEKEWSSEEEEKEWSSASYKYAPRKDNRNHNQSDNENDNDSDSDDHGDDSSIEDESIFESSSSSDDHDHEEEEEEEEEEHAPGFTSTFLRRRRPQEDKGSQRVVTTTPTTVREGPNSPFPTNSSFLPKNPRKPWNRQRRRRRTHCCALYQERGRPGLFCNASRCSSCFLMVALLVWIHVQAFHYYYHYYVTNVWQISPDQGGYAQSVQERIAKARNPSSSSSSSSFWGSAVSNKLLFPHRTKRGTSVEDIPSDCVLQDWQRQTFPNCNLLHEMDLVQQLQVPSRYRREDPDRNNDTATATNNNGRYISSGLWRDVWSLAPTIDTFPHELVVLKMMKPGTYCAVRSTVL
jgi:hypothetical protein